MIAVGKRDVKRRQTGEPARIAQLMARVQSFYQHRPTRERRLLQHSSKSQGSRERMALAIRSLRFTLQSGTMEGMGPWGTRPPFARAHSTGCLSHVGEVLLLLSIRGRSPLQLDQVGVSWTFKGL